MQVDATASGVCHKALPRAWESSWETICLCILWLSSWKGLRSVHHPLGIFGMLFTRQLLFQIRYLEGQWGQLVFMHAPAATAARLWGGRSLWKPCCLCTSGPCLHYPDPDAAFCSSGGNLLPAYNHALGCNKLNGSPAGKKTVLSPGLQACVPPIWTLLLLCILPKISRP